MFICHAKLSCHQAVLAEVTELPLQMTHMEDYTVLEPDPLCPVFLVVVSSVQTMMHYLCK